MSRLRMLTVFGFGLGLLSVACRDTSPVGPAQDPVRALTPSSVASIASTHPTLTIVVTDLTTGQTVAQNETVTAGDRFQVTVGGGADCAGQFVVTALGGPGAPPSALVQFLPFLIGPAVGTSSVSGGVLTANALGQGTNTWKVSASCNGAKANQFVFDHMQFYAQ